MATIAETVDRFVDGFNEQDLDRVMAFFADDAEYAPGDGKTHRGPAQIRKSFEALFAGTFGRVEFDEHDRLVDEPNRRAAIRWTCRHHLSRKDATAMNPVLRWVASVRYGRQAAWEGTDIFHFDDHGRIVGKYTYAGFRFPIMRRA